MCNGMQIRWGRSRKAYGMAIQAFLNSNSKKTHANRYGSTNFSVDTLIWNALDQFIHSPEHSYYIYNDNLISPSPPSIFLSISLSLYTWTAHAQTENRLWEMKLKMRIPAKLNNIMARQQKRMV